VHYYQFNIGDYQSHTKHLTPIEDICYRRLLDFYYLHEQPIPNDIPKLTRLILLTGYAKQVQAVLHEFFDLSEDGWINYRADEEINKYQGFSEAGKRGAAMRWLKGGYDAPNQGPMGNKKQKTINKKQKTFMPENFNLSPRVIDWAAENNFNNLQIHLNNFILAAQSKGYQYVDWDAALMNAIRNNWANIPIEKKNKVML